MSKLYRALERAERERQVQPVPEIAPARRPHRTAVDVPALHRAYDLVAGREYERLGSEIARARAEASASAFMVTSCESGEGASTVAANLAVSLGERGKLNVVLIDGNFQEPGLHRLFETERAAGLTELLRKEIPWDVAVRDTAHRNLHLVTAGKPVGNAAHLFESDRFVELVDEFRRAFDVVIFDAAALLPSADALTLASRVDRVVIVVRAERTTSELLARAKDELENIGASIFGIVLNRKKSYGPRWLQRLGG
jgi:capsular exopolysaccharide synthesis family protein